MLNRRFFINDKEMEIGDISFPLNFQCSDVADLTNVICNYSFTVKLPLTTVNLVNIEHSQELVNESIYPFQYHTARYYVDGVPIFEEGKARVMRIIDSIEIIIMFGNYELFGLIESLKLKELAISDVLLWNYSLAASTDSGFGIGQFGDTLLYGNLHPQRVVPYVKAKKLFDMIIPNYTMPVDISNHLEQLVLPLTSKNSELQYLDDISIQPSLDATQTLFTYNENMVKTFANYFNLFGIGTDTYTLTYTLAGQRYFIMPVECYYKLDVNFYLTYSYDVLYHKIEVMDAVTNSVAGSYAWFNSSPIVSTSIKLKAGRYYLKYTVEKFYNTPASVQMFAASNIVLSIDTSLNDMDKIGTNFKLKYPVKNNLPDVSQKDFIKSIMQLYGLMVQIVDFVPVFFTFNNVYDNFINSFDWSDNLVMDSRHDVNIDFSSDIAEENHLKYKEDTLVLEGYGDSKILATNQFLKERTILTNQIYSASESTKEKDLVNTVFDMCKIDMYELQGTGVYKTASVKQRICKIETKSMNLAMQSVFVEPTGIASGLINRQVYRFEDSGLGLTYDELITAYWTKYSEVMNTFKQARLKFILSPSQVSLFRFDTPIYLRQYGRYFFVKRINNWETNKVVEIDLIVL